MENVNDHSKAKLAIAVLTSPGAAFEEITRRRLLGSALFIILLAGVASAAAPIISALKETHLQALFLGKYNPVAWIGLCMLYTFAMQKLLKWLGTQVDYISLLTLIGWSQITLVLAGIAQAIMIFGTSPTDPLSRSGQAGSMLFWVWYVALMGPAVNVLTGAPKARGILSYIIIHSVAFIGFTFTYSNKLMGKFEHSLPGIMQTAKVFASMDQSPWMGASVLGLIIGIWEIGKHLGWTSAKIKINAIAAGLSGLALFGCYWHFLSQNNYLTTLSHAQLNYADKKYLDSARELEKVLALSKDNVPLMMEIANLYYLAGNTDRSIDYSLRAAEIVKRQPGKVDKQTMAVIDCYRGMALNSDKKYAQAIVLFKHASKQFPQLKEPLVRMAVTYDHLGKYDDAIKAGNKAVLKLGSKSPVVWVALIEAFAQKGDKTQAKAAMVNLTAHSAELAKRVGSDFEDWKHATDKLDREDLKFPLETQYYATNEKPAKSKKK